MKKDILDIIIPPLLIFTSLVCTIVIAIMMFILVDKVMTEQPAKEIYSKQIEKNLRNECLEYQHTQDDRVICIKRLSEEQINQILDR